MSLRPYQSECLSAIRDARNGQDRHLLVVLPCGSGKTVIFSHLPETVGMQPGERMLVLVHRDELAGQAHRKLSHYNPTLRVEIEKAECYASDEADVVVASVQTIGRNKQNEDGTWKWCDRIQRLRPESFRWVAVDESHHALAPSWRSVLRAFHVYKPEPEYDDPNKLLLLVTATPERGDNIGMEAIADRIVYTKPMPEMIEEGWLTDLKAYRINTEVSIADVAWHHGDFDRKELAKRINTPERNRLVVEKYLELGEGFKHITFTEDVKHTEDLTQMFNDMGIRTFGLTGKTPKDIRRNVIKLYEQGYYRGLVSVGVLDEGFDDPSATVAIHACPTGSGQRYRQRTGRVARPFPAPEELAAMRERGKQPEWVKEYGIVLDFCDVTGRHRLITAPTLFGLKSDFDLKGKKANAAVKDMERVIASKKLAVNVSDVGSVEELKAISEKVDLLAKPVTPDVVKQHSKLAWVSGGTNTYQLCLPDYVILKIAQNTLGQYEVFRSVKGIRTPVATCGSLSEAFGRADREVPQDVQRAVDASAQWRNQDPTEKQLDLAAKILRQMRSGFPSVASFKAALAQQYTRGELSMLLSKKMSERTPSWVSKR